MQVVITNTKGVPVAVNPDGSLAVKMADGLSVGTVTVSGIENVAKEATLVNVKNTLDSVDTSVKANTVTPGFNRFINTNGYLNGSVRSASFSNVGTVNVLVLGTILKPGETISFDAGGINNKFTANVFAFDCAIYGSGEILCISTM